MNTEVLKLYSEARGIQRRPVGLGWVTSRAVKGSDYPVNFRQLENTVQSWCLGFSVLNGDRATAVLDDSLEVSKSFPEQDTGNNNWHCLK